MGHGAITKTEITDFRARKRRATRTSIIKLRANPEARNFGRKIAPQKLCARARVTNCRAWCARDVRRNNVYRFVGKPTVAFGKINFSLLAPANK